MQSSLQKSITTLRSPEWTILIGLMAPTLVSGMNHHMFAVALPTIRADFGMAADTASWAVMVYTLPFMALMPLYGRLGDGLGKKRLLLWGMALAILGTALILLSPNLTWFMIGRAVQGVGGAGLNVLCIAIIAQVFSQSERGKMMGTWNSAMPLIGFVAPFVGGLLIDSFGWRAIYPIVLLTAVMAYYLISRYIPTLEGSAEEGFLHRFDWIGVLTLTLSIIFFFLYASSRPITGIEPLQDPRLLAAFIAPFALFIWWEMMRNNPYVDLTIFRNRNFTVTSVIAGLRMFLMNSVSFLIPLYITDIHNQSASVMGILLAVQAGALFVTARFGGQLADRWGSRRPVLISMTGQILFMIFMAYIPASTPLWLIGIGVAFQGFTIGLSLAPLHRSAMEGVPSEMAGTAAGLYSMIRFAGIVLGTALAGVALQVGIQRANGLLLAYQNVYQIYALVALFALALGLLLQNQEQSS